MNSWELLGEDRPQGNLFEVALSTVILLLAVVVDWVWKNIHK